LLNNNQISQSVLPSFTDLLSNFNAKTSWEWNQQLKKIKNLILHFFKKSKIIVNLFLLEKNINSLINNYSIIIFLSKDVLWVKRRDFYYLSKRFITFQKSPLNRSVIIHDYCEIPVNFSIGEMK
jgi:hypothetical protein